VHPCRRPGRQHWPQPGALAFRGAECTTEAPAMWSQASVPDRRRTQVLPRSTVGLAGDPCECPDHGLRYPLRLVERAWL